ncbi:hypothetical protein, partial [Aeromonas veronii]|uniref:hypothetical protein n=1 Tax=Aeromonas veronii TaxID=654 RepID=UPI0005AAC508
DATYLAWIDCRQLGLPDDELKQLLIERGGRALFASISAARAAIWSRHSMAWRRWSAIHRPE